MKLSTQRVKELLDCGANLIINDSYPVEELQHLVKYAAAKNRQINMISNNKGLEDLKRIARAADNNLTINLGHFTWK